MARKQSINSGSVGEVKGQVADSLDQQPSGSLTRRRLFRVGSAAAAGAALTAAASVLGARPAAADGPNVLLGNGGAGTGNNAGGSQTSITAAPGAAATLNIYTTSTGGAAIYGSSGFSNIVASGAVIGDTNNGTGVIGLSGGGIGVNGVAGASTGFTSGVASFGVAGESTIPSGTGVLGVSSAQNGIGVWGQVTSTGGTAVYANAPAGSTALSVYGIAHFSRTGTATISAGKSSATVSNLTLNSFVIPSLVLATLQGNQAGLYIQGVVTNAATKSFTIFLSKAAAASMKVAYFILN